MGMLSNAAIEEGPINLFTMPKECRIFTKANQSTDVRAETIAALVVSFPWLHAHLTRRDSVLLPQRNVYGLKMERVTPGVVFGVRC